MQYDVLIIGGGMAGMPAGIFSARAKLKTLILETLPGGQITTTSEIDNWPGKRGEGKALADDMRKHCLEFGIEFLQDTCKTIEDYDKPVKILVLESGKKILTKTIIVATGASPLLLGVPGEDRLRGQGVAYCATCDGEFFDGLEIVVVGSGNTAMEEAVFLTRYVSKVTMIIRSPEGKVSCDRTAYDEALKNSKIEFIWNHVVTEVYGDKLVEGVKIQDRATGDIKEFPTDGVFIFIGIRPNGEFLQGLLKTDERGYIIANTRMETSVPGIFAAGDVIQKEIRQAITAASDGAIAAISASRYIDQLHI